MKQKSKRNATPPDLHQAENRPRPRKPGNSPGPERRERLLRERLLRWYRKNRRDLPWRQTRDPYAVWVSEIMLQQTRVETVIPYYRRFLERFPDASCLAAASSDEVLKVWENLGYYSRARNLHEAAKIVTTRYGGRLPEDPEDLSALPGIGEYTAGAVGSIAFGRPVPAVDGNVRRVLSRLEAIEGSTAAEPARSRLRLLAARLVSPEDPGAFNQALMDLGSGICTPARPRCPECPLGEVCEAFRRGRQEDLPASPPTKHLPSESAVAAILRDRNGRMLMVRRPLHGFLGGLWKFPGGFLRPGEGLPEALRRTVREEAGLSVSVREEMGRVSTVYSHFRLRLTAFHCQRRGRGEAALQGGPDLRWVFREETGALALSKADRLLLAGLASPKRRPAIMENPRRSGR